MKKDILLFITILTLYTSVVYSADSPESYGGNDSWFTYSLKASFNKDWFAGTEIHERRHDWLNEQEQFLVRPYVGYKISDIFNLAAGYTYIGNSPYGSVPVLKANHEQNFWEQISISQSFGALTVSHRYRQEHRFKQAFVKQNSAIKEENSFGNRLRYRLTFSYWLNKDIYLHVFNEFWLNQSDYLGPESMDRNWLYFAPGVKFWKYFKVEVGFLDQWINKGAVFEHNPGTQLTLSMNLTF